MLPVSVPQVRKTFASRNFSVTSSQSETHSLLVFMLVRHHTHSTIFLKPAVLTRPSDPLAAHTSASGCIAHLKDSTYLLTHLLTLIFIISFSPLSHLSLQYYKRWIYSTNVKYVHWDTFWPVPWLCPVVRWLHQSAAWFHQLHHPERSSAAAVTNTYQILQYNSLTQTVPHLNTIYTNWKTTSVLVSSAIRLIYSSRCHI